MLKPCRYRYPHFPSARVAEARDAATRDKAAKATPPTSRFLHRPAISAREFEHLLAIEPHTESLAIHRQPLFATMRPIVDFYRDDAEHFCETP